MFVKQLVSIKEFFREHRFLFLVFASVIIAVMLVFVSLGLYISSGTAQLDLSTPSNAKIREQLSGQSSTFQGFDANGPLDEKALNEFDELYTKRLDEAMSVDAFGNDVMSPKSLEIDQKSATKSAEN